MKRDRPLVGTLFWVLIGSLTGLILYLGHLYVSHGDEEQVDDHSGYSTGGSQR